MSGAENSFWTLLRAQLAPTPQRVRLAVRTGITCVVSTAILVSLQIPSFALGAFFPLLLLASPTAQSLSLIYSRLFILAAILMLAVPITGALTDLPWVWVPTFFLLTACGLYTAPLSKRPIAFQASMTALVSIVLVGQLDPSKIGSTALWTGCSIAVGLSVAGLFAMLLWPVEPEKQFCSTLADGLRGTRIRLEAALARYCEDQDPGRLADPPAMLSLTLTLQALSAVQQMTDSPAKECFRLNVMQGAQRLAIIVAEIERLVDEPIPPETRRELQDDLRKLREQASFALKAFTARVQQGFGAEEEEVAPPPEDWPDLLPVLQNLQDKILGPAAPGVTATPPAGRDSMQTKLAALLDSMRQIAHILHMPPDLLEQEADSRTRKTKASPPGSGKLFSLDPSTAAMSLKGGLATTLCMVITLWAGHHYLETSMWTTLLLSQSSYGAVVRKSVLRILGALLGGFLGLATILLLMTNATDMTVYLLAIFLVTSLADYGGRSSPHIAYGFLQMGITYMICVSVLGPTSDVTVVLERLLGIVIGIGAIYLCFRYVAPDYAGNQILREFGALLRPLPDLLDDEKSSGRSLSELQSIDHDRLVQVQNLLRLGDEAIFEGPGAGINQDAALAATGTATRVSLRLTSMAFTRNRLPDAPLPQSLAATRHELSSAIQAWLANSLALIETTEQQGQPNSHRRRHGRAERIQLAEQPLPDLEGPLARFLETSSTANLAPSNLSADTREILSADILHLQRLAILAPKLHEEVKATCVPDRESLPSVLLGLHENHQPD